MLRQRAESISAGAPVDLLIDICFSLVIKIRYANYLCIEPGEMRPIPVYWPIKPYLGMFKKNVTKV